MSDYESNYHEITCPYCETKITQHKEYDNIIEELDENDQDFFRCPQCQDFFKVELEVYKEYNYVITKPSKKELKKLLVDDWYDNKDSTDNIIDIPGQMYIWPDLV